MQENKFENQVQKIMEELSLDPGETVWSNVAQGIEKNKKRRRPLFWLFFLAGPLIVGTGYLFMPNGKTGNTTHIQNLIKADAVQQNQTIIEKTGNSISPEKPASQIEGSGNKFSEPQIKSNKPALGIQKVKGVEVSESNLENEEIASVKDSSQPGLAEVSAEKDSSKWTAQKHLIENAASDSTAETKQVKAKDKKPARWTFGMTAGIGFSEIKQTSVNQGYFNAPASSGGGGMPVPIYSAYPAGGISFSAGVFLSRSLSKRVALSAGLNYQYYSSKINIGSQVNNSGATYLGSLQYSTAGYYVNSSTHSYTNQYHFAELPLSIDFTLNKSQKHPLIWQAGFSLAYLLNTNALYFDPAANVYYRNTDLINRVQWNAGTSLMLGWNLNQSRLLLGPELQYGLSSLLKSSAVYTQHLFSYGVKISFIPNIKK